MCTIGAVKNRLTGHRYFFKNLDQVDSFNYGDAYFVDGERYRYLRLPSSPSKAQEGVWSGVNKAGLVLLGADGNSMLDYKGLQYAEVNEPLVIYEEVLSKCGSIWSAMQYIIRNYHDRRVGGDGDIIILGDRSETVALEFLPDRWGINFQAENPYIVRSNFFVLLDTLRPQPEENSLHMSSAYRYKDTLKQLSEKGSENGLKDVFKIVRSHNQGFNAMSICRHGGKDEYSTHCSFVVELTDSAIDAYLILNSQPCCAKFFKISF